MRRSKKILTFQSKYPDHIKGFDIATSGDSIRRSLNSIYVELTESGFSMVATDGHIMVKNSYQSDEWDLLRRAIILEFGADIPKQPTAGYITANKAVRHRDLHPFFIDQSDPEFSSLFPYPKYQNVIPSAFENDKAQMPTFSFEVLAKAEKILKLFGHKQLYFYPTGWNSPIGAAVWRYGDFMLLLMPVRVYDN